MLIVCRIISPGEEDMQVRVALGEHRQQAWQPMCDLTNRDVSSSLPSAPATSYIPGGLQGSFDIDYS